MNNLLMKKDLTSEQLAMVHVETEKNTKSLKVFALLWFFLAGFGGHRYYLGTIGIAVCMTLFNWMTLGLWGIIDGIYLLVTKRIQKHNEKVEMDAINQVKMYTKKEEPKQVEATA
ncbi:TM2 domain-containing protein [Geomicrobium sp. JCM 19055]|uniref:TM2 domain-containing protein n=1 Tax=Geomicrobium sp. JCM 19055 TaxID=1460649 RepID=UPI00045ED988|nr:TM2 domain-containing protein [Geomicrobium sp. JCM 19055]GAK00859.1 hypothetical protein JCM19055_3976 [Geomicrobium sp. JCM 19055]